MRKITKEAARAFTLGRKFKKANTQVCSGMMLLHGNLIAEWGKDNELFISCAGWNTPTTRERINGLLTHLGFPFALFQKDFALFESKDGKELDPSGWFSVSLEGGFTQVARS